MTISEKVKYMMEKCYLSLDDISEYLGITTQSLRNKLNRDSFSINDLIIISHLCHAELNIKFDDSEIKSVTFELKDLPKEDFERLKELDFKKIQNAYESLKETILKLSPEDQKFAIEYLQSLSDQDSK